MRSHPIGPSRTLSLTGRSTCARTGALAVLIVAACWACGPTPTAAQLEKPADSIAAKIRMQGFPCDNPKQAEHNAALSKPNQQVWVLQCGNATYRVRLIPDMAAQVERLD